MAGESPSVFRPGGVTYIRIPAPDGGRTPEFYRSVFDWELRGDPADDPSFTDGSGHVIGHFMAGMTVAGEGGIRPYVYVEDVDQTLAAATAHGGEILTEPYAEGNLRVAVLRDPAGNAVGVWTAP